jgi:hypothetical protein
MIGTGIILITTIYKLYNYINSKNVDEENNNISDNKFLYTMRHSEK